MTAEASLRVRGVVVAVENDEGVVLEARRGGVALDDAASGIVRLVFEEPSTLDVTLAQAGALRVRGVDFGAVSEGRRLRLGRDVVIQVTHREASTGVVDALRARVLRGGRVASADVVLSDPSLDRPRFAVVTASDRGASRERADASGPLAAELLGEALGVAPVAVDVLPDRASALRQRLVELADDELCDLIVTTGGTGLAPRDVTPEATLSVVDREVPGIAEAIRAAGLGKTPFAMLSRAVAGQRGSSLIVNLSGSPKAVREQLAVLIPVLGHVLTSMSGITQTCAVPSG